MVATRRPQESAPLRTFYKFFFINKRKLDQLELPGDKYKTTMRINKMSKI